MYCSGCGNKLYDDQAFCDKCGRQAGGSGGQQQWVIHREEKSAGIAILLSFLWAGAGQLYVGKIIRGIILLLVYILAPTVGYLLFILTLIMIDTYESMNAFFAGWGIIIICFIAFWIWNMFDAYKLVKQYNEHLRATGNPPW